MELLLVLGPHRLEQLARRPRLLLVDDRDREADVDQDPVAGPEVIEEPDVDRAPDAGYVDLGELVELVDDFNDLARDGQAHVVFSSVGTLVPTSRSHLGRSCITCYQFPASVCQETIFPGLNRPSGSSAALIERIIASACGPCSSSRKADLP